VFCGLEKSKTHILCFVAWRKAKHTFCVLWLGEKQKHTFCVFVTFIRKSCHVWDKVENNGRAGQVTDDNIIRRMRIACWITEAADLHLECVIFIALARKEGLSERS